MLSEEEISASPVLFPAGRYEAFEAYVFESSTRLNRTVGLLGLPTPHLPDDQYPHSGKLQEEAYRTPWVRENVFSACKLSLGSPPFEDLDETKQPVFSLERFIVWNEAEQIPSSNPDSLMGSDLDDYLFEESHTSDPCQESFVKCTPDTQSEDLFLPEEILPVDHLAQFRRHLPTLKVKLSRLRILPVVDPLRNSSTGGSISEDAVFSFFQRCESYDKPADVDSTRVETCAHFPQEFAKEPLINKESLLLPDVLETLQPHTENCFSLSSVCDPINVSPELLDEPRQVLEELQASFSNVSLDWISKYQAAEEASEECTEKRDPTDLAERVKLLPEMELDVTFSPTLKKSLSHVCLTTAELQKEELPAACPLSLVSARTQEEMQAALWRAEKHPDFVVRFLLAEPENYEPAVDFQPLCEALTAFRLEKQSLRLTGDDPQSQMETGELQEDLWRGRVFTESMRSESNPEKEERVEVFRKLCLERVADFTVKLNRSDKTHLQKDRKTLHSHVNTFNTNNKDVMPAASTSTGVSDEKVSGAPLGAFAPTDVTNRSRDNGRRERSAHLSGQARSTVTNISDRDRVKPLTRRPSEMDYDPVSAFMMLRSQPVVSVPATPQSSGSTAGEGSVEQTPQSQTPQSQTPQSQTPRPSADTPDQRPSQMRTVVSGKATREQNPTPPWMGKVLGCRSDHQERPDSTVVQVQATDSQQRAYRELQAFALPCLSSARQLGLNIPAGGDFSRLAPDQTHFLLKQQERALHRSPARSTEPVRSMKDEELLFNQATRIHSLVTFKELLLKCDLGTALDYLSRAAQGSAEKSLQELLKRQQIIFFLSQRNHEPNLKLQELQRLLAERQSRNPEHNVTGKILVIMSADSDGSGSAVVTSLKQAIGAGVTAVYPQEGMKKLNGASVVSSVQACVCVVVCEQHIGPDFPWSCFSLLVEYDHPGHSPWAAVCRERSIGHLAFNTRIAETEDHDTSWRLQDNVPYVLLVTERLLNCPLLLQSLESNFTISVLERSSSPSLQMLGGIQKYGVITVDENTVIIIQDQDELCRERVSETLVMRLIALSLQYSCCWLVLHCPDGRRPEFHGEAFSNLVLLYSSLVVFNMRSEFDLDVKVLMVSDGLEMAKWISQICFSSLMCSDSDALSYLSRDWLTVMPSQDELYLSQFPCINPLVAQLMLSRAPSLQWLLRAPLPQLKELLPEVSHKVLKLFTDITAQYLPATDQNPSGMGHQSSPPLSLWSQTLEHTNPSQADLTSSFLFGAGDTVGSFSEPAPDPTGQDDDSDFSLDFLSSSFGSWTSGDPWRQKEEKLPVWTSSAGAVGGVVERRNDDHGLFLQNPGSSFLLDSTFSWSPVQQPPESSHMSTLPAAYCDFQRHPAPGGQSLPSNVTWDRVQSCNLSGGRGRTSASRGWAGRERKRSRAEAGMFGSVLTPLKRRGLSYEKIPGRSDGQTRLRLL